ncbi:MAG: DeoR/GlpR transcriptional regulator, partial [Spirochaetaceae bacterium]|nr:DeoR/GlpR transcriptional regulator [Spirochaetaceae bacterium]
MLGLSNPTTVNKIAKVMEVSHMTIRRDLMVLKKSNMVDIFHGGVILRKGAKKSKQNPYSLSYANKQMNIQKKNIAVKATSYVNSRDTIIIDTGSTIEYFARSLPDGLTMTVICFTLNSLLHISKLKKANIIFPGGYFHENT